MFFFRPHSKICILRTPRITNTCKGLRDFLYVARAQTQFQYRPENSILYRSHI